MNIYGEYYGEYTTSGLSFKQFLAQAKMHIGIRFGWDNAMRLEVNDQWFLGFYQQCRTPIYTAENYIDCWFAS